MKWMLVLAVLVSLGYCQTDPGCPDPVDCQVNPCQDEICPRFLNTRCEADNCNGECRAVFYHGDSVIDTCEVETCSQKICPVRRNCVEEVFPTNCPDDDPGCRQYLRAVCELPPRPSPPSDCSVILCGPDMVCEIFETRNGPEAKCVEFRPSNCQELGPCDPGMECHHRPRGEKHPVVRCVPVRTIPRRPRDCSQVECQEGFICQLFGAEGRQRARCVRDRPQEPKSCQELNCEAVGMICEDESGAAKCRPPKDCSEVDCGDRMCTELDIPDIPIEFRCPFNEDSSRCKLSMLTKLESGRILACRDPSISLKPCIEVQCPNDTKCTSKVFAEQSSTISVCTPVEQISTVSRIATCDDVPDNFCGENDACIDFQQGDYMGFAHCSQINCDENTPCVEEEDTCVESTPAVLQGTGVSHSCIPIDRARFEPDGTCAAGRTTSCNANVTTCTDARMNTFPVGTICIPPFQLPPRDCGQLSCEAGEECVLDMLSDRVLRATCESSSFISQLLSALGKIIM